MEAGRTVNALVSASGCSTHSAPTNFCNMSKYKVGDKVRFNTTSLNEITDPNHCYKSEALESFRKLVHRSLTIDTILPTLDRCIIREDKYRFFWPMKFFNRDISKNEIFVDLNIILQ